MPIEIKIKGMPGFQLITILVIVLLFSSCMKEYHYYFTEDEEYLLPYKIGDSISIINSVDTINLYNRIFEKHESDYGFLNHKYFYEVKMVEFYDDKLRSNISWYQNNHDNNFNAYFSIIIEHESYSFEYSHEISEKIISYESLLIQNINFSDVIEVISYDLSSHLFFNSTYGLIMLKGEDSEYFFYP